MLLVFRTMLNFACYSKTSWKHCFVDLLSHGFINCTSYFTSNGRRDNHNKRYRVLAIGSNIIESANNEIFTSYPPSLLVLASQFGLAERIKLFIQKGGRAQGIADFSYPYIKAIQQRLDNVADVRFLWQYQGIFLLAGDRKESISSINVDVESLSIDTPVVALWSDDPIYADCFLSTFEKVWDQAIPAAQ